jgi:hypothetical protein
MTMRPPLLTQPFLRRALPALLVALGATLGSATPALAQGSSADAGLQAVADLAQLNGEALACQDSTAMRRAKALMLAHAPKTARYASVFDDGTQAAFLATTRSTSGCSEPAARATRLDALAQRLAQLLPAAVASQ